MITDTQHEYEYTFRLSLTKIRSSLRDQNSLVDDFCEVNGYNDAETSILVMN